MAEKDKFSAFDEDLPTGPPTAPVKKEEAKEPSAVSREDYEALRTEKKRAEEMREEAIRAMLDGARNNAPPAGPEPQADEEDFLTKNLPEDVDPDVLALLRPVLSAHREVIEKNVYERYGPVVEAVERDQNLKVIEDRVDGFTKDLLPEVKALYEQLPPEERAEFDNRLGVEVLARRALAQRRGRSDMSGMAHSAPPGGPPERSRGLTEDAVWDMPDDEFENYLNQVRMGGSR